MKVFFRNFAGVLIGLVVGSAINMSLVMLGPSIVPPPPGVDVTDPESLGASMHLFETRHFVVPFVAHALGTFAGATTACLIAISHRLSVSLVVGAAFFTGGIAASFMLPAPRWFEASDIFLAYFPMAWLGAQFAAQVTRRMGSQAGAG